MKVVGIYPQGIRYTTVESGWGRPLKLSVQRCWGEGFKCYKIDDRYYWYYAQEQVYQIEDSEKKCIVFVAISRNIDDVIQYFNESVRGQLE